MGKRLFDDYRKEVKFLIPIAYLGQIETQLNKMQFIEQYAPRIVNSIYYDTFLDDLLNDSLDGLSERQKIRIRFYNNGDGARLEKKIKSDAFGKKEIVNIPDNLSVIAKLENVSEFVSSKVNIPIRATAKIQYERKYYYLAKEKVRVTIDQNIVTKELVFGRDRNLRDAFLMEIKCAHNKHFEINIPVMSQRFSKYAFARFAD